MLVINSSNSVLADGRMSWSGESGQARASFSSSSFLHTVCDSRCPRKLLQLLLTHPHCTYFGRSLLVVTFPGFGQSTATKHISSIKRYKNMTNYIHNCSRSSVLWPNNNNKKTRVHPSRHPTIHPSFQSSFKAHHPLTPLSHSPPTQVITTTESEAMFLEKYPFISPQNFIAFLQLIDHSKINESPPI